MISIYENSHLNIRIVVADKICPSCTSLLQKQHRHWLQILADEALDLLCYLGSISRLIQLISGKRTRPMTSYQRPQQSQIVGFLLDDLHWRIIH